MTPAERLKEIEEGFYIQRRNLGDPEVDWLINRVKQLTQALEQYTYMTRLEEPQDWRDSKEGGPPEIGDYEEVDVGQIAREALEET